MFSSENHFTITSSAWWTLTSSTSKKKVQDSSNEISKISNFEAGHGNCPSCKSGEYVCKQTIICYASSLLSGTVPKPVLLRIPYAILFVSISIQVQAAGVAKVLDLQPCPKSKVWVSATIEKLID